MVKPLIARQMATIATTLTNSTSGCAQRSFEGAEDESRRRLGRGLTRDELERVLRRYPGDL